MRARTQKSGMYWKGVPGIWVMLPPTEPHSGVRSVQLKDAERLRLPPWDGERNSGVDKEKSEWADIEGKKKTVKTLDNQEKSRKWMEPTDGDDVEERRSSTPSKHATHVNIHITCARWRTVTLWDGVVDAACDDEAGARLEVGAFGGWNGTVWVQSRATCDCRC